MFTIDASYSRCLQWILVTLYIDVPNRHQLLNEQMFTLDPSYSIYIDVHNRHQLLNEQMFTINPSYSIYRCSQ